MLVVLEPVARGYFLLGREAPTRGPVLGLNLLAPAQCADAVVELSKPNRMTVDEPHDGHSIQPRPNDGMRRLSTSAPHSPHNGRLVICRLRRGVGHAHREASVMPSHRCSLSLRGRTRPIAKGPRREDKGGGHRDLRERCREARGLLLPPSLLSEGTRFIKLLATRKHDSAGWQPVLAS